MSIFMKRKLNQINPVIFNLYEASTALYVQNDDCTAKRTCQYFVLN